MKKQIACLLAVALCGTLGGCGGEVSDTAELNILTWDGYIPEDIAAEFQEESGIRLNFANFNDNEEMLSKLEATGGSQYDLVIGSDYIIDMARKKDLLCELDKTKIPNYENLDPTFLGQYYDPDNRYTVPYSAGTPLIVYDPERISVDISSFEDLWNPALENQLVMMDDARNVIGITLKTLGKSMNETDPTVLEEARQKLMRLKPNIHHLDYNNSYESMISGEVGAAYMFTPQVILALQARPELKVVYPSEGMGFGIDAWFVPINAPHKDNAYAFLDYILDAENGARISEQTLYLCPNRASDAYLSEEFKNNKALYIPAEILGETEFIEDIGDAAELYDKIWTEFKQS